MRDLIVCVNDPSIDVPIEEFYAHPPAGEERIRELDDDERPAEPEWLVRAVQGSGTARCRRT